MYSPNTMLDRFAAGNLHTASGPKIVVMCFDRLDRDLTSALVAIEVDDHYETNSCLGHAQDLLGEMAGMLDLEAWEHAPSLLSVYDYLLRRLAQANLSKNPGFVLEIQRLVTELGDAFRDAAERVGGTATTQSDNSADDTPDAPDRPRLSVQA